MRYATVCSGIEAPSMAWHPLGWKPAWFSEIEAFPSAVLKHHYPNVPNLGDMTKITENDRFKETIGSVDLFCGGTPCQSFSVAGLRKGMADPRGNLALVFLAIVDQLRPRWVVWENVPGVLSSNGGRDFGAFVGGLGQLGYGWAYRVLDAQYFGVPQRRRRVFVVGYLGDWRPAAAVLFERDSLSGNPAPRREAGQSVAGTIKGGSGTRGYPDPSDGNGGMLTLADAVTGTVTANWSKGTGNTQVESGICIPVAAPLAAPKNGHRYDLDNETYISVFDPNQVTIPTNRSTPKAEICHTLPASSTPPVGYNFNDYQSAVRRLTPRECERLQGFPDDYTLINWTSRASAAKITEDMIKYFRRAGYSEESARMAARHPDGPRYKALGNSMAEPVIRWLGERIEMVDAFTHHSRQVVEKPQQ